MPGGAEDRLGAGRVPEAERPREDGPRRVQRKRRGGQGDRSEAQQPTEGAPQPLHPDAQRRESEAGEREDEASDSDRAGGLEERWAEVRVEGELPGDPFRDAPDQQHRRADHGEDRGQVDADPSVRVVLTEIVDRSV
ncbi:MAG: hypothetical protein M5T61_18330 [Acidimicrobiia bacterium]|nr:hypothetical protein [Acidimicrobiia bacterium]